MNDDLEDRLAALERGRRENAERISYAITRLRIFGLVFLVVFSLGLWRVGEQSDSIQQSREDSIRQSCEDTNARHDDAIEKLDLLLGQAIEADPARAEQIRASRDFTVTLIQALVPRQDCDERVSQLAT